MYHYSAARIRARSGENVLVESVHFRSTIGLMNFSFSKVATSAETVLKDSTRVRDCKKFLFLKYDSRFFADGVAADDL